MRLQVQQKEEVFRDQMVDKLRRQLQSKEERPRQEADKRHRMHEMIHQLRDRQQKCAHSGFRILQASRGQWHE